MSNRAEKFLEYFIYAALIGAVVYALAGTLLGWFKKDEAVVRIYKDDVEIVLKGDSHVVKRVLEELDLESEDTSQ